MQKKWSNIVHGGGLNVQGRGSATKVEQTSASGGE